MKPYKGPELGESKIAHGSFETLGTKKYKAPSKRCIYCNNVFTHPDAAKLEEIYRNHMARKHPEIVD